MNLVIECDACLSDAVERQLLPWSPERVLERVEARLRITGPPPEDLNQGYALNEDGVMPFIATNSDGLMLGLQHRIDAAVVRLAGHLTALHAAVVMAGGGAVVLPGASGAGKTTLAAALVARGAVYYSDEFAFLDSRGWVHAYPRHMVVRDAYGNRGSRPSAASVQIHDAVPVHAIVGLHFEADATFHVDRIASSEAVLLLLANTAHELSVAAGIPAGLIAAAASARSYRGARGDADLASEAILGLIERERR